MIAEILKERVGWLHQITSTLISESGSFGLLIKLSKQMINPQHVGYQKPTMPFIDKPTPRLHNKPREHF